jgi:hypothetical protein
VAGHLAQGRCGEQLVGDHRRHRVARQAEDRHPVDETERQRLGRLDGHLHPAHVADAIQHGLDIVVVAHADTAAGEHRVALPHRGTHGGLDGGLVVGDHPEVDDLVAVALGECDQRVPVGVADLAGRQLAGPVDELVAGGEHPDPRPAHNGDLVPTDAREHTEVAGAQYGPGVEHEVARFEVLAGAAHVVAGGEGSVDVHGVAVDGGPLDHHDGIGAIGHGAPVMMRMASPGPTGTDGASPAAMVPTTVRATGAAPVAVATSTDRTAKPSTAVLANGGIRPGDRTASAVTAPRAPRSGTATGSSGSHRPMTWSCASSNGIIGPA